MSDSVEQNFLVTTLTLTPAVDVTLAVPSLVPGTLHRVPRLLEDPGGKGINVSKALQAFGVPTLATGFLGGSRGRWIETRLAEMQVPHDFVQIDAESRMNVKVSEEEGRLTEFNTPSPSGTPGDWRALETRLGDAVAPQWIALCGRLPDGMDPKWYQNAIAQAKSRGVRTLLDSSGDGFRYGIMAGPDIAKPNRAELAQWIGHPLTTVQQVASAAHALVEEGVGTVVVSLGPEGLLAVSQQAAYQVTVPEVEALSSVGAGDTLVAGVFYGIYHGYAFPRSLQFAAAAGTAAVSTPGTQQPMLEDVTALLPQIQVAALNL